MQESSTTTTTTNTAAQLNPYGDEMSKKVNALGTLLLKEVAQSKQALALYVINNLIAEAKGLGSWEHMMLYAERQRREAEKEEEERLLKEIFGKKSARKRLATKSR